MSIIHDAMKKAGQEKPGRVFGPTIQNGAATPAGRGSTWGVLLLLAALAIAASVMLAPDLFKSIGNRQTEKFASSLTVGPNAATALLPAPKGLPGQFGIEETPLNVGFVLSGIVAGSGRPYGIINGQVVEPGQQISGATVRSISSQEVTLDFNGERIVLRGSESF